MTNEFKKDVAAVCSLTPRWLSGRSGDCCVLFVAAVPTRLRGRDCRACPKILGPPLASIAILAMLLAALPVRAATNRWVTTGTTTNDWFNTNNWSTTNVPAAGDDVIINYTNANVLLTNSTAALASLLMSNSSTLIFSNWDTALTASNVSIWNNAKMTCIGLFKNNAMSNRVYVVCTNFTLQSGGSVDVIGRGYTNANGPGTPTADDNESAGSYGGWGAGYYARAPYGSAEAPLFPGSGANPGGGGHGGGAVRIDAQGAVTISGTIYANGADGVGNYTAGGSGGGIYITCNTLAGTGGIVRANGGIYGGNSGAGGGGRIAVVYNTAAQSNESPSITFSVLPGSAGYDADIGTLYFPDNQLLGTVVRHSGKWMVPSFTNWAVPALTINNASIAFPSDGFALSVGGDLTITGSSAKLFLGSNDFRNGAETEPYYVNTTATGLTLLQVGGNLVLTNSAQLYVYSGDTNSTRNYGALIDVTGDVFVANGSELYLYSQQVDTNSGASPRITARNVTVASGGTIYARGQGPRPRIGRGRGGSTAAGAGHGGQGGYTGGGATYGSSNAPMWPGSGGGSGGGPYLYLGGGGSLVRIEARESVRVDGTITAAGGAPVGASTGGGSGGGIFIMCRQFEGGGTLSAAGGPYYSGTAGGGGGGRIAVWFDVRSVDTMWQKLTANSNYVPRQVANLPQFIGTVSVAGGAGSSASYYGTNGTIMYIQAPAPGTIFTIH